MAWDRLQRRPTDPVVRHGLALMGEALKRRRERVGLSQRELARRTGVQQSAISRFERGDQFGIRWAKFAKIVVVLDGLDFTLSEPPPKLKTWSQLRAEIVGKEIAEWDALELRLLAGEDVDAADEEGDTEDIEHPPAPRGPPD